MTVAAVADILIAGVGHPLMGDDSLGLEVIRKLAEGRLSSRTRLYYAGASPLDILGELSGITKLIIVDALMGVEPGEIIKRRYGSHHSEIPLRGVETHGIGLADTLTMARELYPGLDIIVIGAGIEPAAAFGSPLSHALCERIPELIQIINEEIAAPIISS
jgi:hydrogenase maturation protease